MKLKLGKPVALENGKDVTGLPAHAVVIQAAEPKEDPSKKSFEEQDKS